MSRGRRLCWPPVSAYVSRRQHPSAYGVVGCVGQHRWPRASHERQHTSAYVSIRQHPSASVSIRQHPSAYLEPARRHAALVEDKGRSRQGGAWRSSGGRCHAQDHRRGEDDAFRAELEDRRDERDVGDGACIRQHTSAYVSIRQHTSAYASIRQQTRRERRWRWCLQWSCSRCPA